jgi:hypothetical protein
MTFFGPETVLGLESAILGRPYTATAEIVEPAKSRIYDSS